MRAIVLMFDSLIRGMLPPYGCEWVQAPNFQRLADSSVTFDNCYAGSMPCMPARRELHTGRYTFLHRGWGPLEPFDDSVPEMLKQNGVHTHLVTDHLQYWDDGGAGYASRYSTFEFFRGQEGEPWKGELADPSPPEDLKRARGDQWREGEQWRQDWINRRHLADEADHPQTQVFDASVEFIRANQGHDRWMLQIDAFDPHEPFFSYDRHKALYPHEYDGPHFDWPDYLPVTEPEDAVEHARFEYAALLSMCDESLGRILDAMDEHAMWDDTMLIVCTDHGYLLGEHGWWGKVVQPWYDEIIHIPLFVWDPRSGQRGDRRESLVQTFDLAPTLLDFFDTAPTGDMQGAVLRDTISADAPVREAGLFGMFGGHVCVTDGRYVYMRASKDPANQPLFEYTLMPTEMFARFPVTNLRRATLAEPFSFTKGVSPLRIPGRPLRIVSPWGFGSLLYDLHVDPQQQEPLIDDALELRMTELMVQLMRDADAPAEQFERLGLPVVGAVETTHLLVRAQWPMVEASRSLRPPPRAGDFPDVDTELTMPLGDLVARPDAGAVVREHAPALVGEVVLETIASLSLIQLAEMGPGVLTRPQLADIASGLVERRPGTLTRALAAQQER
jgi:arylsulfatase A-like enzyme